MEEKDERINELEDGSTNITNLNREKIKNKNETEPQEPMRLKELIFVSSEAWKERRKM